MAYLHRVMSVGTGKPTAASTLRSLLLVMFLHSQMAAPRKETAEWKRGKGDVECACDSIWFSRHTLEMPLIYTWPFGMTRRARGCQPAVQPYAARVGYCCRGTSPEHACFGAVSKGHVISPCSVWLLRPLDTAGTYSTC